jgi:hypothetical protein
VTDTFFGADSSILLADDHESFVGPRAWMFREADATAVGWEVYARKDKIGDESGISLDPLTSKILAQGKEHAAESSLEPSLVYAMHVFSERIRFGDKFANAEDDVDPWHKVEGVLPTAEVGYRATVLGIKAAEAVSKGARIEIKREDLLLG